MDHVAADVGQAEVAALELVGQPLVVDAEQVQHRGVQVVDVDDVLDGVVAELVGAPWVMPPLMPPPASQIEKPLMWWSRPLPWAIGVRPNSPPQTTSVSSSMPRCFRSCQQSGRTAGRPPRPSA